MFGNGEFFDIGCFGCMPHPCPATFLAASNVPRYCHKARNELTKGLSTAPRLFWIKGGIRCILVEALGLQCIDRFCDPLALSWFVCHCLA